MPRVSRRRFVTASAASVAAAATGGTAAAQGAKKKAAPAAGPAVPRRLRLGRRHRRLPGRGRLGRGREGPFRLGHVRPQGGRGLARPDGRRGLRSLSPLSGRRLSHEGDRPAGLSLQRELAAGTARGSGGHQPQGARVLRPADRRAARGRDRALGHLLSLGLPARAPPPRRLAEPRLRAVVRRLRGAPLDPLLRPRDALDDPERAAGLHRHGAPLRPVRARGEAGLPRVPAGDPPRAPRPGPGGAGAPGEREEAPHRGFRPRQRLLHAGERLPGRRGGRAPGHLPRAPRLLAQRVVDRPRDPGPLPRGRPEALREGPAVLPRLRPRRDAPAARLPRPERLQRPHGALRGEPRGVGGRPGGDRGAAHRQRLVGDTGRPLLGASPLPRALPPPDRDHRERDLRARLGVARRPGPRRPACRLHHALPPRAAPRDRGRDAGRGLLPLVAASTTSSGPRATRTASAWSSWTSPPRSAP